MKLKLYSIEDKYSFSIGEFSSLEHHFFTSSVKKTYNYAWEAYKEAKNIGLNKLYHVEAMSKTANAYEDLTEPVTIDASAEEMITNHYLSIFNLIKKKANGLDEKDEKREMVYGEIKGIVEEILKVKEKLEENKDKIAIDEVMSLFRGLVSKQFKKELAEDIKKKEEEDQNPTAEPSAEPSMQDQQPEDGGLGQEMQETQDAQISAKTNSLYKHANKEIDSFSLEDYGYKICKAIEKRHPSAICRIGNKNIHIIESSTGDSVLKVGFNNLLNIDKIVPLGKTAEIFPINSLEFYQRYWKPIVESVGHFFIKDENILLSTNTISLPDIPKNCPSSHDLKGINLASKKKSFVVLAFKGKNDLWEFEKKITIKVASSPIRKQYTEEDFIQDSPKIVKCIDPELETIYQKTGEVVQVIPLETHIEIDVDFGRAIMRLTGDQVEIINDI